MGDIVNMSGAKNSGRGPNSSSGASDKNTSHANFSCRLFLVVNVFTFKIIDGLRDRLEAHSYGDVIRQAVRAFAICFVENKEKALCCSVNSDDSPDSDQELKRLNIRVPIQTKERLDLLKELSGLSYTDIMIKGLELLSARARDEEVLLSLLGTGSHEGGEDDLSGTMPMMGERQDIAIC